MLTTNEKFSAFTQEFTKLMDSHAGNEREITSRGRELLHSLVQQDDWLPDAYAQPNPQYYQQYALYVDPQDRFSVVSFVWGPGQKTPIHNHTVWALIGMLRGAETAENFKLNRTGEPMTSLGTDYLKSGSVEGLTPSTGDIHRVSNAYDDRVSISIHVYGGNIGRISRHVFDEKTGITKQFISGYSNQAELDKQD